jgi:hypothetical protein
MALLPEVEAVLKDYSEADQKVLRPLYEANPALQAKVKEQMMGQSEVSRKFQEAAAKAKDADKRKAEADALYGKNMDWFRDSEADVTGLETENKRLKAEVETLKAATTAAAGARSEAAAAGAPPAEMAKIDADVKALRQALDETRKLLDESEKKVATRFDAGGMFLVKVNDIAQKHVRTFNEPFSQEEFIKYMTENKLADPAEAYKVMTAEKAQKKWETEKEAEIRKKIEAENAARSPVPYMTGQSPLMEQGPMQRYLTPDDKAPKTMREAVAQAAAELRSEGKA